MTQENRYITGNRDWLTPWPQRLWAASPDLSAAFMKCNCRVAFREWEKSRVPTAASSRGGSEVLRLMVLHWLQENSAALSLSLRFFLFLYIHKNDILYSRVTFYSDKEKVKKKSKDWWLCDTILLLYSILFLYSIIFLCSYFIPLGDAMCRCVQKRIIWCQKVSLLPLKDK